MSYTAIQNSIEKIMNVSNENYNNSHDKQVAVARLRQLGFTSCKNIKDVKINEHEVNRSKLSMFFKKRILTKNEIETFCEKYNLQWVGVERYTNSIPTINVDEMMEFDDAIRTNKWNKGFSETDNYFIPLGQQRTIVAPKAMFRKPEKISEMTKEEYQKFLEDDPLVFMRVFHFNPRDKINEGTDYYVLVTAWDIEAALINNQ